MLYERVTDTPSFVSKDYETEFAEPLIANDENEGIWQEFWGTGVPIDGHPLERHINFSDCGACKSHNVKVIYATWSVSTASGDAYWDSEIVCEDCGKFTARSFNEND